MTGYQSKKAAAQFKVEGPLHVVCQCDKCKAQPAQEPVAWMWKDMSGTELVSLFKPRLNPVPLYIAPPQRPWVDLTDEEIKTMDAGLSSNASFYAGALWAEAKLKEKNNG